MVYKMNIKSFWPSLNPAQGTRSKFSPQDQPSASCPRALWSGPAWPSPCAGRECPAAAACALPARLLLPLLCSLPGARWPCRAPAAAPRLLCQQTRPGGMPGSPLLGLAPSTPRVPPGPADPRVFLGRDSARSHERHRQRAGGGAAAPGLG